MKEILPGVVELTLEEGRAMLDERCRAELGISVDEFLAAYDRGEIDHCDSPGGDLIMLIPFARDTGTSHKRYGRD